MSDEYKSAVHRVLGDEFDVLPAALRQRHDNGGQLRLSGRADVILGKGPLPALACWMTGMPRDGLDQPVTVEFTSDGNGVECWRRDFAGRRHSSLIQSGTGALSGYLVEHMGIMTIAFELTAQPDRLTLKTVRFDVLGVTLPRWLSVRCAAFETYDDDRFTFDIAIDLPLIGRLITYRGTLAPEIPCGDDD